MPAAIVGVATYGLFGEPERATGRWLPYLRLGRSLLLGALAVGPIVAAANAGTVAGGEVGKRVYGACATPPDRDRSCALATVHCVMKAFRQRIPEAITGAGVTDANLDPGRAVPEILGEIVRDYGVVGLDDEVLLSRVLPDLLANQHREIRAIRAAASAGTARLLAGRIAAGLSVSAAVADVAAVVAQESLLNEVAAGWVTHEYATVLGYRPDPVRSAGADTPGPPVTSTSIAGTPGSAASIASAATTAPAVIAPSAPSPVDGAATSMTTYPAVDEHRVLPRPPRERAAVLALTFAILGLDFPLVVPGVLAIIYARKARRRIRQTGHRGGRMATMSFVLGCLDVAGSVVFYSLIIGGVIR